MSGDTASVSQSIRIEKLEIVYNNELVLSVPKLEIRGPGLVQVLGPNGAGKTTLLRSIAGLIKPFNGKILINNINITGKPDKAGKYLGYVPQRPPIGRYSPINVFDLVCLGLITRKSKLDRIKCKARQRVLDMLSMVGLTEEVYYKRLWELSGGQVMRAFIARTLAFNPPILLLDEPLSPVDPAGKASLARLIGKIAGDHLVLVSSHDPVILLPFTSMIILVNRGVIAYGSPRDVLREDLLRKVYGEAAVPVGGGHVHIVDSHSVGVS